MADISNVIRVLLLEEGQAAQVDNINIVSIITGNQGVLSSDERFRSYRTSSAVEADFGAASQEAAFANSFFGTSPNSISAGGSLVMSYWRASDEVLPATAAYLLGEQKTEASLIPILNGITDGSFTVTVDGGAEQIVTGYNGTTDSTLDEVATKLNASITGATVTQVNGYFIATSDTTGVASLMTFFGTAATGTDISTLLGMSAETGATLDQGEDAVTLPAESKLEGLSAIKAVVNIKGAMFIDQILDADVSGIASWAMANEVLMYEPFGDPSYLVKSASNPAWQVKLASQKKFRCLYTKAGNRKYAATYMARMHTVIFTGQNTAITMNLKALSVPAEDYTQTEIDAAKLIGLDIFTTIKNTSVLLTSGANDFCDNVYNLMAFVDSVETGNFNYLKGTPTKIPQTDIGIDGIEDDTEKTCQQYVNAGVFAPGTWTLPDFFGDRQQFLDSIATKGFYVLAGDLADQTTANRQARIAPTIQIAVKNAGAVHEEDIIITFNK